MGEGNRPVRPLLLSVILCAAAYLSCGGGASGDMASVEVRDGVRIVKNPLRPTSRQSPPSLLEDLVIGASGETRDPILFRGISHYGSVDVDASGNIYIADAAAYAVVMVDSEGKLVRTIGREGQGPGEFQSLSALRVLAGDRLAVYDRSNRRLSLFGPEGGLVRETSLAAHPDLFTAQIDSRGNIFGIELSMDGSVRKLALLKISSDGTASARLASATRRLSFDGSLRLFSTRLDFRLTPNDEVVWGSQTDYVLHILDNDGGPKAIFEKAYEALEIGDRDIETELSRLGEPRREGTKVAAPDHFPPFNMLLVADDGRIFVRVRERTPQGVRFAYDVFDGQGFYLYRMRLPGTPVLIKAGRLYSLEEDGEGAILIRRYVMK